MSSITGKSIRDGIVIISTEGYFNKDLGEALKAVADEEIKNGHKNFLINLENSKIVNSIGASILIEILQESNGFKHRGAVRERPGMEKASILSTTL